MKISKFSFNILFLLIFSALSLSFSLSQAAIIEKPLNKTTIKNKKKWSPWSLSGFSLLSVDADSTSSFSQTPIFTYNYVGLNYKLASGQKISVRPAFIYQSSGVDSRGRTVTSSFKMDDTYLNLADYNAALLPGNIGLSAQYRAYLPTSERSQDSGRVVGLGGWFTLNKPVTSLSDISYHIKPKFYVAPKTYTRTFPDGGTQIRQNKQIDLEHYVEWNRRITPNFSIQASLKHYYDAYPAAPEHNKEFFYREDAGMAVGLDYGVSHSARVIFIIEQKRDVKSPRTAFKPFRKEETSFTLLSFFRLGYL